MEKRKSKPKTEYGAQFTEKQEVKRSYGLRERQFRRYFKEGVTAEGAVNILEKRLDNVVYRAGFAPTRKAARQLVTHGHFRVNGKNIDIPSYQVNQGAEIFVHPSSQSLGTFKDLNLILQKHEPPSWLILDANNLSVKVIGQPAVEETFISSSIKPIVEFYSR